MIDGVKIAMGRVENIVPPLSLKQVRNLSVKLAAITAGTTGEEAQIDAAVDIIHAALTRNYASLTRDQVETDVDLGNIAKLIKAVMGQSGLSSDTKGEGTPLGE